MSFGDTVQTKLLNAIAQRSAWIQHNSNIVTDFRTPIWNESQNSFSSDPPPIIDYDYLSDNIESNVWM